MVKVTRGIVSLEFEDGSTLSVGDRMERGIVVSIKRCEDDSREESYEVGLWDGTDWYYSEYVDGLPNRWARIIETVNI